MKKAAPTPTPSSAATEFEDFDKRLRSISAEKAQVTAAILECEARGDHLLPPIEPERKAKREAVLALLNGSAHHFAGTLKGNADWKALIERRNTLDEALERGSPIWENLRLRKASEALEARRPEIAKIARRVADALFALDEALQDRDDIAREVGAPLPILLDGCYLCGRLSNSGSQTFVALQALVRSGHISKSEFRGAYEKARKACLT